MRIFKIFIYFTLVFVIITPLFALAQGPVTGGIVSCGREGRPDCTLCEMFQTTKNLINFLTFNIAFPLTIIALIIGGVLLLTSGGSEEKRTRGKHAVTYAILGLVLVFAAWLIIDMILRNLINEEGFDWTWNEFPTCEQWGE